MELILTSRKFILNVTELIPTTSLNFTFKRHETLSLNVTELHFTSRNFILKHHGTLFLQRHRTQKHTGVSLNVKAGQ